MAKAFNYTLHHIYGVVDESPKRDWGIVLNKVSWGDRDPVIDLRRYDLRTLDDEDNRVMAKGVSFYSEEGLENLIYLAIENGFGTTERIQNLINSRGDIFTLEGDDYADKYSVEPILKQISKNHKRRTT